MNKASERERFELFLERIEKLQNNSLIKDKKLDQVKFLTEWDENEGLTQSIYGTDGEEINTESFDSLTVTFRLMYMDKERISVRKIIKGLHEFVPLEEQYKIEAFEKSWAIALNEDSHMISGTKFHSIKEILDSWLFGEVTHSDIDKRRFLKQWGGRTVEAEVVFIVRFLIPFLLGLGNYVRKVLDEGWV